MRMITFLILFLFTSQAFAWQKDLQKQIEEIDSEFDGDLGIVIKDLKTGERLEYNAKDNWYLSSTMKLVIAVSFLEAVEAGKLSLEQKITLKSDDFVDGTGPMLWSEPGKVFTLKEVLKYMLVDSDNTAADILVREVGVEELNRDFKRWMGKKAKATSLLQVRYLAYGELHPKAQTLTNMDYVLIKNEDLGNRHKVFSDKLKIPKEELQARDLEEAFERFYSQGYNSAKLTDYVSFLEKLESGKLLSPDHTKIILSHMEEMKTGEHRIKAGLDPSYIFQQKTGTQIHRACNVGFIKKSESKRPNIALAMCITKPEEHIDSDSIFKKVGTQITKSGIVH